MEQINTLGSLKASGYTPRSIQDELRANLIMKMRNGEELFKGILGYEDTVIPAIERAILARHSINLLGLRGQAKTRIARQMVDLLDEYIPVVAGSELNDDPMNPLSRYARDLIDEKGDDTPIEWMHRSDRYTEKLATPDVTVADLIGDSDPIKASNLGLDQSDERVIHFGLIPRSNRCIFVINELPDLQPRIQVALFNILQEGDIQIRGFKMRLPLDVQFVFTANPEDYTNRGAIITPLKDRIQSQILTHYPSSVDTAVEITEQEARVTEAQSTSVHVPTLLKELIELVAIEARYSDYVDQKSGVSTRLTISAMENLVSAAERRAIINKEKKVTARISDLFTIIPAITGKVELVYEGEQEGPEKVAYHLISKALNRLFVEHFPRPGSGNLEDSYSPILAHFGNKEVELLSDGPEKGYDSALSSISGLKDLVKRSIEGVSDKEITPWMELVLHGLAESNKLGRSVLSTGVSFNDLFSSIFSTEDEL
jgi:magnesium chelatase subunit I